MPRSPLRRVFTLHGRNQRATHAHHQCPDRSGREAGPPFRQNGGRAPGVCWRVLPEKLGDVEIVRAAILDEAMDPVGIAKRLKDFSDNEAEVSDLRCWP